MKKHSLLKSMVILVLLVLIASYFLDARAGEVSYLPFGDIVTNYIQSYYYFFDTLVFILMVGAFYGVLNKTVAYKKLLDNIVLKVKSNSKRFIFICIIVFALLTSLTGITLPLIVFIPFVVSIILLLGYDKLVAISATVLSILVGSIGGIFVTFRSPGGYSAISGTTFEDLAGIDKFTNIIPEIILLVLGVALLILFVNKHIKNVEEKKVKYELNGNTDLLVAEVKGSYKEVKTWPLIIILSLLLIIFILGLVPWDSLFKLEIFTKFHTWITGLNVKEFYIFTSIISTMFPAFGHWTELGSYMMPIIFMLLAIIIIKFIYRVKLDDTLDGMIDGAKKILPTAMLVTFAYTILICTYNNGFIETIISNASKGGDINFVLATFISMIGSILHVDLYYTVAGVFTPIIGTVTDEAMFSAFALSFQTIYGLMGIIAPTSLLLIFALSYLDVPYTTWLKYIWRFVLSLFIIIFAVLIILSLI